MSKLPYTVDVRLKSFSPANLDLLIREPFCFFLDSAEHSGQNGRYSFFGWDPVRIFSSTGGFITVDGHTYIDDPIHALEQFEASLSQLPFDPYLPFQGGLVGFVGHDWPHLDSLDDPAFIPDAWFGLYDTIITYDHLERSCWISSAGLARDGTTSLDLAKFKCERILERLQKDPGSSESGYIIKPLMPEPISTFNEGPYVHAIDTAKRHLNNQEWQRATVAQRFHAPVATSAWSIHKLLRQKNPTPFASFLRCGHFELLSTSPSCFLRVRGEKLICNVVQKSMAVEPDPVKDKLNQIEFLHSSPDHDPVVMDDEHSLAGVLTKKPDLIPAHLESDTRSHYLVNQIQGQKAKDLPTIDCLAAAMPGASMTGVPKTPVNKWLRKTEPARRNAYTGAIGYIGGRGNAQFNMAVRTMIVKDQVAFVHSGQQVETKTEATEAYYNSKTHVNHLFEEIKTLGSKQE